MITLEEPIMEVNPMSLKLRQKQEAVSRLMHLKVPDRICREYDSFGRVHLCTSPSGKYSLIVDPAMLEKIKAFEENASATVFLVIRMQTFFGLLDSYIFVSKYDEEWPEEIVDLNDGYLMTYTVNHDNPECSEYGSICFERTDNRGIIRVG